MRITKTSVLSNPQSTMFPDIGPLSSLSLSLSLSLLQKGPQIKKPIRLAPCAHQAGSSTVADLYCAVNYEIMKSLKHNTISSLTAQLGLQSMPFFNVLKAHDVFQNGQIIVSSLSPPPLRPQKQKIECQYWDDRASLSCFHNPWMAVSTYFNSFHPDCKTDLY